MPRARVSANVHSPTVDVTIDTGHPLLNRTVDGFLKIGGIGATHAAAQCLYTDLNKGGITKHDLENMIKRMGKEGAQWGFAAGLYTGMHYGMERVRGRRDWKNALLGGALTAVLITACEGEKHHKNKLIERAITGGAIATASELLRHLT